jgi:uncharacterized protein YhaN
VKIATLDVEGFGVWTGLRIDNLADGLNVFYGPNEAGKTTLMQFARAVLYGFSPDRQRYLPPVHGGRPGGTLELVGPNGAWRASRFFWRDRDPAEELELVASDGTRHGEHVLKILLSDIDESIFNNVFAVGLNEIQELATLNGTEAASLLYKISAGLDRVSLIDVMRELNSSRDRFLDIKGGPSLVTQLLADRDRLRAEIDEAASLERRHSRLAIEREQLEKEIAKLEEENKQFADQLRTHDIALAVRQRWDKRKTLDAQLAAIGPLDKMPDGVAERFDSLENLHEERQTRLAEAKQQLDQLQQDMRALKINAALLRQGPRLESLQEQIPWLTTLETRIRELDGEIAATEASLQDEKKRLGLGDRDFPSVSPRSLAALKRPAHAVQESRHRLLEAQEYVQNNRQTAEKLGEKIKATLDARGESDLAEATERIGGLVGQLRRRVQIDERLQQMDGHHAELEEQCRFLLDRQMLPGAVLIGLGGVFVAGVMLLLLQFFGSWVGTTLPAKFGLPAAFLGLVAAGGAVVAKNMLEKSNARQTDQCQKQLHLLHLQMKQAKEERASLDRQIPEAEGPPSARLQTAERELASLEELTPIDARRQSATQDSETASSRLKEAEQELAEAKKHWNEATAAAGLPKGLGPKQVRELATRYDLINELRQRLERQRAEHEQRSKELQSLTTRIEQVAEETGFESGGATPIDLVRNLGKAHGENQARLKRRRGLRQQAQELHRKLEKHETAVARAKRRKRFLLDEIGAQDEHDFRHRASQHAQVVALRTERDTIQREIEAAIGGHCSEEVVARELEGNAAGGTLESRREQIHDRLKACETQLRQRFEKRGQQAEQLRLLAENRTAGQKQLELGMVQRRIDDALRRWRVLAVTHGVLENVRKTYEQTRQPESLQEASQYLEKMSQGRYRRVWTPLSDDVLFVDDADGKPLGVEVLSRGAREQLFLSLRLALARSYAKRGAPLPLVLDDVLVNFDGHRAEGTAAVLRDFAAAGHQMLVFTCHEHIAKLFQSLDVSVHELPSNTKSNVTISVAGKLPKPKRKRHAEEEAVAPKKPERSAPPAPVQEELPAAEPLEELAPWEEDDSEELGHASRRADAIVGHADQDLGQDRLFDGQTDFDDDADAADHDSPTDDAEIAVARRTGADDEIAVEEIDFDDKIVDEEAAFESGLDDEATFDDDFDDEDPDGFEDADFSDVAPDDEDEVEEQDAEEDQGIASEDDEFEDEEDEDDDA